MTFPSIKPNLEGDITLLRLLSSAKRLNAIFFFDDFNALKKGMTLAVFSVLGNILVRKEALNITANTCAICGGIFFFINDKEGHPVIYRVPQKGFKVIIEVVRV